MDPLGKALNKILNPSVENAATTFSNNYNNSKVSFEGFFGDMFNKLFSGGNRKFKNPTSDDEYYYSRDLKKIMDKTILNSSWYSKNPGREIEVSQKTFSMAFLFESGNIESEYSEWKSFRENLLSELNSSLKELVSYEFQTVKDFLKKCPSDPNSDEVHDEMDSYSEEIKKKHAEILKKFKPIKKQYKNFLKVEISQSERGGLKVNINILNYPTAKVTPDEMIKFVNLILKDDIDVDLWDLSIMRTLWKLDLGPHFEDGDEMWGGKNDVYGDVIRASDGVLNFTAINQEFLDSYKSKDGDVYLRDTKVLGNTLDKMFGASDDS